MLCVPIITGARGEGPASGNSFMKFFCNTSPFGYLFLSSSCRHNILSFLATNMHVVRTGVPMANGGRRNHALIRIPLLFIILGTVGLGGFNAAR